MKIVKIDDRDKLNFMELLFMADEDENMIGKYLQRGEMFALYDEDLKSVCVVTSEGAGKYELKNLATKPECQGKGYGKALVSFILNHYRHGGEFMYVGTGDSPLIIGFYESCGFAYSHTVKNFFTDNYSSPIIEDGKRLVHMIYLKKML